MDTRSYLDFEFIPSRPDTGGLISLGLVDDEGNSYYAVNQDMDQYAVTTNQWLRKNVWPHLPLADGFLDTNHPDVKPLQQIRYDLVAWFAMRRHDRLFTWYGSQDMSRLHSFWDNNWAKMPDSIPQWSHEIASIAYMFGSPQLPEQLSTAHNALDDAKHNRHLVLFLRDLIDKKPISF